MTTLVDGVPPRPLPNWPTCPCRAEATTFWGFASSSGLRADLVSSPVSAMPSPVPTVSPLSLTATACLAQAAEPPVDRPPLPFQLLPLVAIAAAAYLLLFRPERDRLRRQQSMLAGLKKNDRVVTSSGIYGTVASVDPGADRVVLRVDEAANAKLTVTLASIARILGDGGDSAEPKSS